MLVATLRTRIVEQKLFFADPVEGGFYVLEVRAPKDKIAKSGDPRGYVFNLVAQYLASSVQSTTVPKEKWTCEFSLEIQKKLNLPEIITFDGEPL